MPDLPFSAFFRRAVESMTDKVAADIRKSGLSRLEARAEITNEVFSIIRSRSIDVDDQIHLKALATVDAWLGSDLLCRKMFPAMRID